MARVTATPVAPPVIYLGPSAPRADIEAILPGAVFRPPVRRGDLYRDRLLRFSVFLIIDGVFAQEEAIPPREVVDVLQDGGRVIGAASMGALRACDCRVAGAVGIGTVYRLFQSGAINSEDEVAVTFRPDRPYPALTVSLISVRVALRRAVRRGDLVRSEAIRLADAAAALHYADRSWAAILKEASASGGAFAQLAADDAKRDDTLRAARYVARRLALDAAWGHRPRRGAGGTFPALLSPREKPFDPDAGWLDPSMVPGFVVWCLAAGRWSAPDQGALDALKELHAAAPRWIDRLLFERAPDTESFDKFHALFASLRGSLKREGAFEAEVLRYCAACSFSLQKGLESDPNALDLYLAEMQIAQRHGFEGWTETLTAAEGASSALVVVRNTVAIGKSFRRAFFSSGC